MIPARQRACVRRRSSPARRNGLNKNPLTGLIGALLLLALAAPASQAAEPFTPASQPLGWVAPFALSTTRLDDGAQAYRPWFDNNRWQGDLIEYTVASDGALATSVNADAEAPSNDGANWSARLRLAAQEAANAQFWDQDRQVITTSGGSGIPLRWDRLSGAQQQTLGANGPQLLAYVRGDRSQEQPNGPYRDRDSLLGAIVHSNPVHVGAPQGNYTFDQYGDFRINQRDRAGRVYVGANDGMLHAFAADTGEEVWAYVPAMLLPKLKDLAQPGSHPYFVDGPLSAGDVQINGQWRTVLVGGLGAGGRGLFALDVTDPGADNEAAAAAKVLWEIGGGQHLGYTYAKPQLARLNDDRWYAVVGNGYNSASGRAGLLLIDVANGQVTELLVPGGSPAAPNGLASPTLIDVDHDARMDIAYAGDVNGNLWKFDLGGDGPGSWQPALGGQPLFQTGPGRPITTAPQVTRHPNGGFLVYMGTGRLLSDTDTADTTPQALYGIWDRDNGNPPGRNLFTPTLNETTFGDQAVRVAGSTDEPQWNGDNPHDGWRLTLQPGERVVTPPRLRAGRLQVVTTNPTAGDQHSWLLQVHYLSGGAPQQTVFDLNDDGALTSADHVNTSGDDEDPGDRPAGRALGPGLHASPRVARVANGVDATFINGLIPGSGSACVDDCANDLLGGHIGVTTDSPSGGEHTAFEGFDQAEGLTCDPRVVNTLMSAGLQSSHDGLGGCTDGIHHFYDDDFNRSYVDFSDTEAIEPIETHNLNSIRDVYPPGASSGQLDPDQRFAVLVANADLNTAAAFTLGDQTWQVEAYQHQLTQALASGTTDDLPTFTLNEIQATGGDMRVTFDTRAILNGGVLGTHSACVRGMRNPETNELPVAPEQNAHVVNDRWRDGALVLQLVDAAILDRAGAIHVQQPDDRQGPSAGARISYPPSETPVEGGLLYELAIFWDVTLACYGHPDYTEAMDMERLGAALKVAREELAAMQANDASQAEIQRQQGAIQQLEQRLNQARIAYNGIGDPSQIDTGSPGGPASGHNGAADGAAADTATGGQDAVRAVRPVPGPRVIPGRRSWADVEN